MKIYLIFIVHFFTDLSKAKYDYISIKADQIIHYLITLVFVYKNLENKGVINLNGDKRNKNEVIE